MGKRLAVAAGLGIIVALTVAAAPRAAASGHDNVGAPHSPQLEHQLARSPAGSVLTGAKQGVDVASYQERYGINWSQAAAAGIQFAAIKATEGDDYYQNPYALTDIAAARAVGLSVLAYGFAIPDGAGASANPATQADYLVSYLENGGISPLPPLALDIEYNPYSGGECYGLTQSAMVSWVAGFLTEVRRKTGRWPAIYTPPEWWQKCTDGAAAFGPRPAVDPRLERHHQPRAGPRLDPGPAGRCGNTAASAQFPASTRPGRPILTS